MSDFWSLSGQWEHSLFGAFVEPLVKDWLYGEYDEEKLKQFQIAYSVPGVRNYMDYLLDSRADQEYLRRYGMDYSDIHDPRKLRQTRSGAAVVSTGYRAISSVSSNVARLYE